MYMEMRRDNPMHARTYSKRNGPRKSLVGSH